MDRHPSRHAITPLDDRAIIEVRGADARRFLHGLLTNDIAKLEDGRAAYAALLSPQGKIQFVMFVVSDGDRFLIDVALSSAAALVKRLALYKLRADVTITDVSARLRVLAEWGGSPGDEDQGTRPTGHSFTDPRHQSLGRRILVERNTALPARPIDVAAYVAHRISLGVPDAEVDFPLGDTYPHDANFDLQNGVSFTKGCYVGQEIVARMQHKSVVRKRIVRVTGSRDLPADQPEIAGGGVPIGRLGSVSGQRGLALLRLDRVAEFRAKGVALEADGILITIEPGDESLVAAAAKPEERPAG
ncbi:MAG: folate-binding protein [Hyphomicrobium sp.]|nr:folate-binding protein [Hyphomicrobium sp.]